MSNLCFEILYKSLCTSNAERGNLNFSVLEFLGCIEFPACNMNFMSHSNAAIFAFPLLFVLKWTSLSRLTRDLVDPWFFHAVRLTLNLVVLKASRARFLNSELSLKFWFKFSFTNSLTFVNMYFCYSRRWARFISNETSDFLEPSANKNCLKSCV